MRCYGREAFRPVLTLAHARRVAEGRGTRSFPRWRLSLIHSYSLVHDDLRPWTMMPCGGGKPTWYKKFGEQTPSLQEMPF